MISLSSGMVPPTSSVHSSNIVTITHMGYLLHLSLTQIHWHFWSWAMMTRLSAQKNYLKPMAGNSYLHFKSCHYPKWIHNIPKGRFCRLRQNCIKDTDYVELSANLKSRFLEKQYPKSLVEQAYEFYLYGKSPKTSQPLKDCSTRFITTFHSQHKKMENILSNHWDILQDPHLKSILTVHPRVINCRARNLKNKIAPSKFKSTIAPPSVILTPFMGMYQCRKALCKTCKFLQHGQKSFSTKGKTFPLTDF